VKGGNAHKDVQMLIVFIAVSVMCGVLCGTLRQHGDETGFIAMLS
jgi:hypothetical protein